MGRVHKLVGYIESNGISPRGHKIAAPPIEVVPDTFDSFDNNQQSRIDCQNCIARTLAAKLQSVAMLLCPTLQTRAAHCANQNPITVSLPR